jgi:hypothetical protein
LTVDFENSLIRKLSEQIRNFEKDPMGMGVLTSEIMLNATFGLVQKVLPVQVEEILSTMQGCFFEYLRKEEEDPFLVNALLK